MDNVEQELEDCQEKIIDLTQQVIYITNALEQATTELKNCKNLKELEYILEKGTKLYDRSKELSNELQNECIYEEYLQTKLVGGIH